jgi:hypothetical protein
MKKGMIVTLILAMGVIGNGAVFAGTGPAASDCETRGRATTAFFEEPVLRDSGVWVSTSQLEATAASAETVTGAAKERVTVKE